MIEEYIKFALGSKGQKDHFIDKDGDDLYIIKSKSDIKRIKKFFKNKHFGYLKINNLPIEDLKIGYHPNFIVVDKESNIKFNDPSSTMVMVIL